MLAAVPQIDAAPAHHSVLSTIRTGFDDCCEFGFLGRIEPRLRSARPAVGQTIGAIGIEAMHPVAQGLPVHAADPGCFAPVHPVVDGGDRQQPAAAVGISATRRKPAYFSGRIVIAQSNCCWHRPPPGPATLESEIS